MRHFSFLLSAFLLMNLHVKAQELTVSLTSIDATCSNSCNGSIDVTVSGGTGPYSYNWSDMQNIEDIVNLCAGAYVVLVTDNAGDTITAQVNILAPAPLVVTVENDTVCLDSWGELNSVVTGGTPGYIYEWNGPNNSEPFIGPAGVWTVAVIDANGCATTAVAAIIEEQTMTIDATGSDATCAGNDGGIVLTVSGGVLPYEYWMDQELFGSGVFSGLSGGDYTLQVIDADGCTIDTVVSIMEGGLTALIVSDNPDPCLSPFVLTALPYGGLAPYTYAWSTEETTSQFTATEAGVVTCTVTDVLGCSFAAGTYVDIPEDQLDTYIVAQLRRGFCDDLTAVVSNNSCEALTGPVTITLLYGMNYSSAVPAPDVVEGNTIRWNSVTIPPDGQFAPLIEICVPLTMNCGAWGLVRIITEVETENHFPTIFCSFDPNDKQVWPIGENPEGYVGYEPELTYTVRFQNTGNIAAEFIHIIDTLDTDLDISTLRVLGSSHPMELRITEGNIMDFFFDQINLPDSTSDLEGSQGYVVYWVKAFPNIEYGTPITNTAHIIFDFNEPVITNTTLNSIGIPGGIEDSPATTPLSIHPNPSNGRFTITPLAEVEGLAKVTLFDVAGRVVLQQSWSASEHATLVLDQQLDNGMYMVNITTADGQQYSSRVVIAN